MGDEPDDKRICFLQFIYNLANHFRWFRIFKNCEKAIGRLVNNYRKFHKFALFLTKS